MQIHLDTDIGGDTDDLCALEQILAWPVVTLPACMHDLGMICVVGDSTTISFAELEPLQSGLRSLQFGRREGVHPIFKRARRVLTATPSRRAVGKGESQSHERIDRVDAYSTAMAYVGAPATGTLVADAVMLMGTMLRDVRVIDRVLDCAGPSEEWAVRGLLVAAGLLGVAPQPARWIPRPECVDAGLLATVIADPFTAREVLRRLTPMLDSGGRHRVSVALDSVEAGEWLALVG